MNPRPVLERVDLRGSTARLCVPRVEDAEQAYAQIAGRREILEWLEWPGPDSVEQMRDKARHWRTEGGDTANYQLAIHAAAPPGAMVGALSLRFVDHPERGDLGYWIAVEHQGRGYASDAVGLALWLAFEALDATSVSACVFVPNQASRRVLEKHGFELQAPAEDCGQRARWNFLMTKQAWLAGPALQRPLEFELQFAAARP